MKKNFTKQLICSFSVGFLPLLVGFILMTSIFSDIHLPLTVQSIVGTVCWVGWLLVWMLISSKTEAPLLMLCMGHIPGLFMLCSWMVPWKVLGEYPEWAFECSQCFFLPTGALYAGFKHMLSYFAGGLSLFRGIDIFVFAYILLILGGISGFICAKIAEQKR